MPGIFSIHQHYYKPIEYFQNAHVYNYYKNYLLEFFEELGLKVVYWDERCTFIIKKPETYKEKEVTNIIIKKWEIYSQKILKYLKFNRYFYRINPFFLADKILKPLWLYDFMKKIYFKLETLKKNKN